MEEAAVRRVARIKKKKKKNNFSRETDEFMGGSIRWGNLFYVTSFL